MVWYLETLVFDPCTASNKLVAVLTTADCYLHLRFQLASNHQFTMFKLSRAFRTTTLVLPARSLLTTPTRSNTKKVLGHSADNYSKDVDVNPPDDPSIYRVDSSSDSSQKPYEPPSGKWSQAGIKTKEYEHVSRECHIIMLDVDDSATKTGTVEGKAQRLEKHSAEGRK